MSQASPAIATARGYTLIEMLFVIVIIAIMTLVGIKFLNSQVDRAKIKAAKTEIHRWLQAGLAYYEDYTQWPTTLDVLMPEYMPTGSNVNPWGQAYTVASSVAAEQGVFGITTILPTDTLAARIAARLPFTSVDNVTLSAYAGTAIVKNKKIILKKIGSYEDPALGNWQPEESAVSAPKNITKPTCPGDMVPSIAVALNGFQKGCFKKFNCDDCTVGQKLLPWKYSISCSYYDAGSLMVLAGGLIGGPVGLVLGGIAKDVADLLGKTQIYTGLHEDSILSIEDKSNHWKITLKTRGSVPGFSWADLDIAPTTVDNRHMGIMYVTYCVPKN